MSALAHLGANGNSPKQMPTLSCHQNAIAQTAGGDPYPATSSVVSLALGPRRLYALTLPQSQTSKALGERMAQRRQKSKVGISAGLSVRALT